MDKANNGIDEWGINETNKPILQAFHGKSDDNNTDLIVKNVISKLTTEIVDDSLGDELETSGRTSKELEYIFIYPKELDENYKRTSSESCEPKTSHLEQADAMPEKIVEEELENIFKHTFDSVHHKKLDNPLDLSFKTDTELNDVSSGDSFQDLEVKNSKNISLFIYPNSPQLNEIWQNKKVSTMCFLKYILIKIILYLSVFR